MALINDTEHLVDGLFRGGSTNNEALQALLWQLKMISELSDEELQLSNGVDIKAFYVGFLTNLANRYRPTNASRFPKRLLSIEHPLSEMRIRLHEETEKFIQKMLVVSEEQPNRELVLEYVANVKNGCSEGIQIARNEMERLLVEINY
jgi:hypothetical protein